MAKQTNYNAGIYVRLSQEDMRAGESLSIENQKMMLTTYVKEQGWNLTETYVDDGWSGTDFERPAVQKLLEDAKNGKINLIIVKDLSRFGRNYIEVGRYIDYIFPLSNIRFIALNDNIDTANMNSPAMDMMPIINLFNEWHSASTSKKIKAVATANANAGKYSCNHAAYGYIKGTDPKHLPVLDPETAPVVKRIFEMRSQGISPRHIADQLNDENLLCPLDYFYSKRDSEAPVPTRHLWSGAAVNSILTNPIYLGKLAQMRTTTVSHKNHKLIYKDESDWVVVENTHEPIVTQELWDKCREVEKSVSQGKRTKTGIVNPLSGIMFCADCGYKMRLRTTRRGNKTANIHQAFNCTSNVLFGNRSCPSHYITMRAIQKIIVAEIRSMANLAVSDEESARKEFLAKKDQMQTEQFKADSKKLADYKKRIAELDELIQSVYEDKVAGKIPESVCIKLLEKYEMEQRELTRNSEALEKNLEETRKNETDVNEFIRRLKKYTDVQEITREMCLELIEYITVDKHPEDKSHPREIHIYYKLLDKPISKVTKLP